MAQRDNPAPALASHTTPDLTQAAIAAEKEQANNEAQAIPIGIPFPTNNGLMAVRPATNPDPAPTTVDSLPSGSEKPRAPSSSGSTADSPGVREKKKPFSFGKKRKEQDEEAKKAKEKEEEATKARKVSFLELFRFARPLEITFNIIGLVLAAASGAAQPLMTLIFGRLTNDFTAFGALTTTITEGGTLTPAQIAQLEAAKANLKTSAGHNALYLMAIGIGMFLTTWAYMFIWNWTGEVNAKRVRERYLHATLRQEVSPFVSFNASTDIQIAYFDDLGAGEVATRIQTDCLLVQEGTSEKIPIIVGFVSTFFTGFILAFTRSWRLTLVLSCILPVIMIGGGIMTAMMKKHIGASLVSTGKAGSIAEEVVASIRTIHAFGTQKLLGERFNKHIDEMRVSGKKSAKGETVGLSIICEF